MSEREPGYWDALLPWQRSLIKFLFWFIVPAFFLTALWSPLAVIWWFVYGCYYAWKLLRLALTSDREEKSRRQFEKDFKGELSDLEVAQPPSHKPKFKMPFNRDKPSVLNSQGEPMYCIMACGKYTNEGGRFCDEHDD